MKEKSKIKSKVKSPTKTAKKISTKNASRSQPKASESKRFWNMLMRPWGYDAVLGTTHEASPVCGRVIFIGKQTEKDSEDQKSKKKPAPILAEIQNLIPHWQQNWVDRKHSDILLMSAVDGPLWLLRPRVAAAGSHRGTIGASPFGRARDLSAQVISTAAELGVSTLRFEFIDAAPDQIRGVFAGLEIASYRFQKAVSERGRGEMPRVEILGFSSNQLEDVRQGAQVGMAVNVARHLTNLPAGDLHPQSFAESLAGLFEDSKSIEVEIWDDEKLAAERCNLLRAVGQAAPHTARLVHLRYRPSAKTPFKRPVAIVGKGVTFDTGGLDIKPASGMRIMKKDMGGAAALAGLAWYLDEAQIPVPCDLYFALAENSVDGNAFHPGDIITARNGLTVEIHNTDAEGRLVMADAIDVALTNPLEAELPLGIIDASTLTGAMRVAVGTQLAGMFSNSDTLAAAMEEAGQATGEPCWRLPLYGEYKSLLKSNFADISNCSDSPFAGGITAALFLEKFVRGLPWVHFDMYGWTDRVSGAYLEAGGNGSPVQLLIAFFEACKPEWFETSK